jgi:molecular chaperone HscB
MRCWRCGEGQAPTLSCARCAAVQEPIPDLDHFSALGLPHHPRIDARDVASRFYDLSRRLHPDRFQTASPEELASSVKAAAALNAAFQTLRDVEGRGRYWLGRLGEDLSGDDRSVPPDVAELVFEVQEKLATCRRRGTDDDLRAEIAADAAEIAGRRRAGRAAAETILESWPADATGAGVSDGDTGRRRAELKRVLSELSYLRTLERDVRATLETSADDGARQE